MKLETNTLYSDSQFIYCSLYFDLVIDRYRNGLSHYTDVLIIYKR